MDEKSALALSALDAHDQAKLVAQGEIAPGDPLEAALLRIEASDLNAVTHRAFDLARQELASGRRDLPMAGIPWLVKDSLDYPGMPTRSAARATTSAPAGRGFPFVDRLRAAGMIAAGKSNMPEFALAPVTEGTLYGPTRNPWSADHTPGGSSGGAAAAVAAGLVPFAHASDGGGSIRIPASCCGLIGYKPGRGFNLRPRAPHIVEDMIVGDSLLARSARDTVWSARLLRPDGAVAIPTIDRPLRIAMITESLAGDMPEDAVVDALVKAARLLEASGHIIEPTSWPTALSGTVDAFVGMWSYLALEAVASLCDPRSPEAVDMVEPWTLGLARSVPDIPGHVLEGFYAMTRVAAEATARLFESYDLILSPVNAGPPPRTGHLAPTRPFAALRDDMFAYVAYTPLQNLTGLPSVSLPVHVTEDGLPVGAMLTAPRGGDDRLLDLLGPLEALAGWDRILAARITSFG